MEEKKPTDEEIVKGLKCCAKDYDCNNCPVKEECCENGCNDILLIEALDLINRQKAEIERLTEYAEMFEKGEIGSPITIDKMLALEKDKIKLQKQVDELKEEMHKIESSANETYMLGFEEGSQKAVKDTAKEIERDLEDKGYFEYGQFTISGNDFIEIFKKRGVEVK